MDLLALVDRLEELIGSAQKMPIGSRAIVDRRRLLDIVDQMRIAIPQEVREAREMVAQREQRRMEAEEEARLVIARAEDRAARMVEQHELTLAARKRAEEVATQAEQRLEERIAQANADIEHRIEESRKLASQQMDAADTYARELLERLDRQLLAFVRSVQSGIAQLEPQVAPEPVPAMRREEPTTLDRDGDHAEARESREPARIYDASRESATPIPLRRDDPQPTTEGGLQNLLRRPTNETLPMRETRDMRQVPPRDDDEAPVIIDDFEMPDFDDTPREPER